MKELATPNSVNHTDTLMPPGDCGRNITQFWEQCNADADEAYQGVLLVTCIEDDTAKDRMVADTMDKASWAQKLIQPRRLHKSGLGSCLLVGDWQAQK